MLKFFLIVLSTGITLFLLAEGHAQPRSQALTHSSSGSADQASKVKPQIQQATPYQSSIDVTQYWVSEKLDGVRGYWNGKQLLTRSGNLIKTPKNFTRGWPNTTMDGELWIARNAFEQVSGCIRKKTASECWHDIRFYIFDLPNHQGNFTARIAAMKALTKDYSLNLVGGQPHTLNMVKQYRIGTNRQLQQRLVQLVGNGAEGLMLHHQDAYYHAGRTDKLVKLKMHQDAEAIVVAHHQGKGKYQHKLGALEVEMPNGIRFKIGSGFSDQERENPPKIGATITYKYIGKTQRGVPRFASFLRVRPSV